MKITCRHGHDLLSSPCEKCRDETDISAAEDTREAFVCFLVWVVQSQDGIRDEWDQVAWHETIIERAKHELEFSLGVTVSSGWFGDGR